MELKAWYTRKNWTTDEVETLRLLARDHLMMEIVAIMGRSENSLRGASHRFNIPIKRNAGTDSKAALHEKIREMYKTTPISKICQKTGMDYHTVYRIVVKKPGN